MRQNFDNSKIHCFALMLAWGLLAGCSKQHALPGTPGGQSAPARHITTPRQIKKSEMSDAEQKYGIAPVPDASVEYQPDVIVVGGGAESVREQHANGFMWSIDAGAAHADELKPGKILFLTNRAVGRVLGMRKEGDTLVLVLGPVEVNELFRNAHIHIASMPVDFGEALTYTAPDMPGQAIAVAQNVSKPASAMHAMFVPPADTPTAASSGAAPTTDVSNLVHFKVVPTASTSGLGVRATSDAGGLKVKAEVLVHLSAPTMKVTLDIKDGAIQEASLELLGAAGLTWNFDAGTDVGRSANVHGVLTPDTDFSIPVGGLGGAPLAITVRQRFQIETQLNVRNTTLAAKGKYTFNGGFLAGYRDKKWGLGTPLGFKQAASFAQTGDGVSLGLSAINLGHSTKIIVGIGAWGFAAGPYFTFFSAVGLAKTSDIGMLKCFSAPVVLKMNGGVGYMIPQTVTRAINSILRAFNIRYELRGEGGLEPSEPVTMVNMESRTGGCRPPAPA